MLWDHLERVGRLVKPVYDQLHAYVSAQPVVGARGRARVTARTCQQLSGLGDSPVRISRIFAFIAHHTLHLMENTRWITPPSPVRDFVTQIKLLSQA